MRAALSPVVIGLAVMHFGGTSARAQAAPRMTPRDLEAFSDSVFKSYVDHSATASLAIIVVRADSVILQKGYGLERVQPPRPVDPDSTLFHVASVSKLFVATAAMQLAEGGRLRLDDSISRQLPDVIPIGALDGVTMRQLLTHTSGLDAPFMRGVVARPEQAIPLEQYFSRYPPRLGREPGREIRYSNDGMSLAALAIETAAHQSFHDYVAERIFGPLGMRRSTFLQPPPESLEARVATGGSGRVPNALILYPSGSMVCTAADMGRFMRAHLGGKPSPDAILSTEALAAMHAPQWRGHPRAPGVAIGFFESDIGGEPALFHTGARTHFSLLYLIPKRDLGIFIVHSMRQGGPFQSLRTDYVRAFMTRYFPISSPPLAIPLGAAPRAERLAGTYRPILLSATTIERAAWLGADTRVTANGDGSLTVAIPVGPALRAWEVEPGRYVTRVPHDAGLTIAFSGTLGTSATRMFMSGGTQDPVGFDRLAWYQRGSLHAATLASVFVIVGSFCLVAAARGLVRRIRRRPRADATSGERRAWHVAVWSSALVLAAPLLGLAVAMIGRTEGGAADGLRHALIAGLSLLLVGCMLALATLPAAVVAWRRRYWTVGRRVHITVFACATALLVPLLVYYHLFGFWL